MIKSDVLIVTDNNIETVGGEQESTKIILNSLSKEFNISLFQPGKITNEIENVKYYSGCNDTRVKHIFFNPFKMMIYIYRLQRVIKRNKPEIIHTQAQVSFILISLLKKIGFISKKIKIIHTERGLYTKYSPLIREVFLFFMKEIYCLVTTTNYNLNYWGNAMSKKKINIKSKVIPNTAGQLFETYDLEKDKNDNSFTVGFSGRYTDWKNWPLAEEIIRLLNNKIGENLKVSIAVGALDQKAFEEANKMFKKIENYLGDRFRGQINISLEEMNVFYYDLDVFILTSKPNTESFGRTLVEAMSRKTAVFTTNAGGSEEVVGNEYFICYSIDEIVEKTMEIYSDRAKLEHIKNINLDRVRNEYSLTKNVTEHFEMYTKVLT